MRSTKGHQQSLSGPLKDVCNNCEKRYPLFCTASPSLFGTGMLIAIFLHENSTCVAMVEAVLVLTHKAQQITHTP